MGMGADYGVNIAVVCQHLLGCFDGLGVRRINDRDQPGKTRSEAAIDQLPAVFLKAGVIQMAVKINGAGIMHLCIVAQKLLPWQPERSGMLFLQAG